MEAARADSEEKRWLRVREEEETQRVARLQVDIVQSQTKDYIAKLEQDLAVAEAQVAKSAAHEAVVESRAQARLRVLTEQLEEARREIQSLRASPDAKRTALQERMLMEADRLKARYVLSIHLLPGAVSRMMDGDRPTSRGRARCMQV